LAFKPDKIRRAQLLFACFFIMPFWASRCVSAASMLPKSAIEAGKNKRAACAKLFAGQNLI
jgi:hypothetical protein